MTAIAVAIVLVVPPLVSLVNGSLHATTADGSPGALTLGNFIDVLHGRELVDSAINSLLFALGTTTVALFGGASQAWIVERSDAPFKILAYIGAITALATPFILYVLGFLFLFSRVGPINELLELLFNLDHPPLNANSLWGMIWIEGILWIPLVFLILAPVFRAGNPALEEAALTCGASRMAILWRITMKLAWPAVLAILLLVFVRSLEAFEVPILVGLPSRVNVLTTDIFLQLKSESVPDFGRASAFSVLLMILVAALLALYHRALRHAERYQTVTGKGYQPNVLALGWGRVPAALLLMLNFFICVVMPIGMLFWVSISPYYQAVSLRALSMVTLRNYGTVFQRVDDLSVISNTLMLAAGVATTVIAIAGVAGWLIGRAKPGARILDQLGIVPLVFPGVVLALAVLQIFIAVPLPIYGTLWILLIAFTIRYLPFGIRYSTVGVLQLHKELEEVASTSGASLSSILLRVVRPLISPALVSGWLFVFLLTSRDLAVPLILSGTASHVVAEYLYLEWLDGQTTELAALGLIWTAVMTLIAVSFHVVARRMQTAVSS